MEKWFYNAFVSSQNDMSRSSYAWWAYLPMESASVLCLLNIPLTFAC